ncbi:MAG TPA: 4Fe-4S binding protein [Bacteroidales bacterium]|nr:4Fe-4S binding protein [Bacteroidales bacterium]
MRRSLKPEVIRIASSVAALLLALPIGLKGVTGLFIWTSPFIMLNSVIILKSFVLLNIIGITVLIVTIFKSRFFCRYMCPTGLCCDKISDISRMKSRKLKKMPPAGKWLAIISLTAAFTGIPLFIMLDPLSIFQSFFSIFTADISIVSVLSFSGFPVLMALNYFLPDIWCTRICPLGGLQDIITDIRKRIYRLISRMTHEHNSYSPARRYFLASGVGLVTGFSISKLIRPAPSKYFRPPGSVEPVVFNTLCIRCGNCIKSCPTKIISQHTDSMDLISWMTPEVKFVDGYCLETCNICSTVCPTGSITLFSPGAKNRIFMGSAEVIFDKCLLSKNRECDRCRSACKYSAVNIEPSDRPLMMTPVIDRIKCVGCGACSVICPTDAINMIPPGY